MNSAHIPSILVNGFLSSGKTTYIQDCFKNDYFYKKGRTLLLSFEEGEMDYDLELLKSRRTDLAVFSHSEDPSDFLKRCLERFAPDRVYVEMNAMIPELCETLSSILRIDFSVMLIEVPSSCTSQICVSSCKTWCRPPGRLSSTASPEKSWSRMEIFSAL